MKKKLSFITLLSILSLGILSVKANAVVQIVPTKAENVTVNVSVTQSYDLCRNLTNAGEMLYGSTVVPHLVTNKDWGAVSYLAQSVYGSNGKYENKGTDNVKVTIDGITHYSTTGNITGVMNWGTNPQKGTFFTQTSSLIKAYTRSGNKNLTSLENNRGTRFVETIDTTKEDTIKTFKGRAFYETREMYNARNSNGAICSTSDWCPISIRKGLFSFNMGTYIGGFYSTTGEAKEDTTYRAAFWNK